MRAARFVLNDLAPAWFDGKKINLPPAFGWGSRIMGTAGVGALPGVPNQVFPGFLNINRTQDVAGHVYQCGAHVQTAFTAADNGKHQQVGEQPGKCNHHDTRARDGHRLAQALHRLDDDKHDHIRF